MDLQKEREVLIAEIEVFKAEMLKSYVIKAWADSYVNTDPFSHVFTSDGNNEIWWMKAQAHELWHIWQAAKAQAIPEGFVLVPKEPTDAMLFAASGRDIVAEHYGDENIMWPELRETWKAMLEAVRGGNE